MRLFLAIDLQPKIKKKLEQQILFLKKEYADFNWVTEENYHITLLFFGEIINSEKLLKKIEAVIYDIPEFPLYSTNAGLFLNHKLVLYINFRRERILEELVKLVKQQLQIDNQKKFIPHLTIARTKVPSKQQYLHLKKKMHKLNVEIEFIVKKIYLFQSILEGPRPVYKKITGFPLIKKNQS